MNDKMNVSAWKKLEKIDFLIKENASNWFQQMKSHLCDEKQWKIIRQVINKWERKTIKIVIRTFKIMFLSEQIISEETFESASSTILDRLADDEN